MKRKQTQESQHPHYELMCKLQDIRYAVNAQRSMLDKIDGQLAVLLCELRENHEPR